MYTPRRVKPALKRRFRSTCSALYELSPLENQVQVLLSVGLALVVVGTKYEPAGTRWPARPGGNPGVAGGTPPGPAGVGTGYVAGHGDAGQITGNGSLASMPIISW